MTVISANIASPVAMILIDPVTGNPYKAYSAPISNSTVISANYPSPKAVVALDTNGATYKP